MLSVSLIKRLCSRRCFVPLALRLPSCETYCFGWIVMLSCPLHRKSLIKSGLSTLAWHVISIDLPTGLRCGVCVGRISRRGAAQFTLSKGKKE